MRVIGVLALVPRRSGAHLDVRDDVPRQARWGRPADDTEDDAYERDVASL